MSAAVSAEASHELRRMESAVVRAALAHPDEVEPRVVERLRYLLGFARLTAFQPGAAADGPRAGRADVDVTGALEGFREHAVGTLAGPLRQTTDPRERLRGAAAALELLAAPLDRLRAALLDRGDFSAAELDAEAGRRTLVSVAGGGGGAGFVYIGAYRRLERDGIVPAYVIGASIGALLGIFRARAAAGAWEEYIRLARGLDRRVLFQRIAVRRRHGLPGLLSLRLAPSIGPFFLRPDGEPERLSDLDIPYDAVVAGVRRRSFDRLPRRFRAPSEAVAPTGPATRRSPPVLAANVATRMWQVAAFFDPRVVKPVVLGGDPLTAELNAVDAAGFSAAIPGVLHYDADPDDERANRLLDELVEREEVAALVDGGVASNVPADVAWQRVQEGRIGTRNAFLLAFDCFHPQWDPRHLWLQPITQAVQLQMTRNAPFADWIVRFEPTLSPINLVPSPERLDEAIGWGESQLEELLPTLRAFLAPASWTATRKRA